MENMWDERYRRVEYVYGREPNDFFSSELSMLAPGKILLPGEGEGRNAVHAAIQGWNVYAFDLSVEGKKKAFNLAMEKGVKIRYEILSYTELASMENEYDVIGLFYTHQASADREKFHRDVIKLLKPGGSIILEGFGKKQIENSSGGPGNIDFLFSIQDLAKDFEDLQLVKLQEVNKELEEGVFHQGNANLIQMVARK